MPGDDAVIITAVRTPIGRAGGSLATVPAWDLATQVVRTAVERSGIDPADFDDVILGETIGGGGNIGRYVGLAAGLPWSVPGYTVIRACATGLEAILQAALRIGAGDGDTYVTGGAESMSQQPFLQRRASKAYDRKAPEYFIPLTHPLEMGPFSVGLNTGENVAERFGVTREQQDAWAYRSHMRAVAAIDSGAFTAETLPVDVGSTTVTTDEHPRRDTTLEKLASLKPVFKKDGTVTAGNSSGINDAASALVLTSARKAASLGLTPRARVVAFATAGVDPNITGSAPMEAVPKVLKRAGLSLDDIDLIELNEAFAAMTVACVKELGLDEDKTNVNGGAIALGHPVGATGARLVTSILHELERRDARYGLVTMCAGGGLGQAAIIERI
jgi:acetyl-CoA C-acetyltransferase